MQELRRKVISLPFLFIVFVFLIISGRNNLRVKAEGLDLKYNPQKLELGLLNKSNYQNEDFIKRNVRAATNFNVIHWFGDLHYYMSYTRLNNTYTFYSTDKPVFDAVRKAEVKDIQGILTPTKMVVENIKEGTKTLLIMNNIKINSGIKDDIFTIQNLER